jgi:cytochrome c556
MKNKETAARMDDIKE